MNIINMQRRLLLGSMAGIAFAWTGLVLAQQSKLIEVWKDPSWMLQGLDCSHRKKRFQSHGA